MPALLWKDAFDTRNTTRDPRVMQEEWGAGGQSPRSPRTIDGVRRQDLYEQHSVDVMRGNWSPFGQRPRVNEWRMFKQEGSVVDGVWSHAWCVYPCDDKDPMWERGIWFDTEQSAIDCLVWKRELAAKRPWPITRTIVRLWRALPWR